MVDVYSGVHDAEAPAPSEPIAVIAPTAASLRDPPGVCRRDSGVAGAPNPGPLVHVTGLPLHSIGPC